MTMDEREIRNIQRHAFQLTINNPVEHGYEHKKIKELLVTNFSTLAFFCMADEVGENKTPHTHIYTCFKSRVRFQTIKKHFPTAHIEPAHGNVQSNIDYIKKSGKWEQSEKAETTIRGTYEEWGTVPLQKGTNTDMQELYQLIEAGYSNSEILAINNDYILNIEKLDRVRTTLLTEKFKNIRRLDLKVIYISGATGTGKTRSVLDTHGDSNVYRVSDHLHPFDGYACQAVIAFDEFRSQIRLSDMLNYCDIYPIELPARYANKFACYDTVYILSNWPLEEQYKEIQKEYPQSWRAFLRRIHEVRVYDLDGSVSTYGSVEDYFNGAFAFRSIEKEELSKIPFE